MKDQFTDMNQDDDLVAQKLDQAAEQIHISPQFVEDLEQKLRQAYRPRKTWFSFSNNRLITSLGWITLLLMTGLVLDWSIRNLVRTSPGMGNGTTDFTCPVTRANGNLPPGTQTSENQGMMNFGNDKIWTILPPDGKIHMLPENQLPNGWLATSWPWWQETGTDSYLSIKGHRLDAEADAMIGDMSDRFNNFLSPTLNFPTTGCWEITARAGEASLTIVVEVVFDEVTPTPDPITPVVTPVLDSTAIADNTGYDWRGTKLFLASPLPGSPAEASVYQIRKDELITPDEARAFASRFGLQGEMYSAYDYVFNTDVYYFTDGRQALQVYSHRRFTYIADDLSRNNREFSEEPVNDAESTIRDFLTSHGFDFPFKITWSEFFGGYSVEPIAPDGLSIQYESYTFPPMLIKLDENGEVLSIDATLIEYDAAPLGTFGVITAQEALDTLVNDDEQGGKTEFFYSAVSQPPQEWYRSYPDNQTVTIHGYINSNPAFDPSKPPFIAIDGVPAIGNTAGLDKLERSTFIEATGQYILDENVRKFKVDSWKSDIEEVYVTGSLHKAGDQIILIASDAGTDPQAPLVGPGKQYTLTDPPADVPVDNKPDSQLAVQGVLVNGKMDWYYIQYFENIGHGGGGGGGGLGFYQLNLSGTPVAFPTSTVQPPVDQGSGDYTVKEGDTLAGIADNFGITVDELMQANEITDATIVIGQELVIPGSQVDQSLIGQKLEGTHGIFQVNATQKTNGSQTIWYGFFNIKGEDSSTYYILEGSDLQNLHEYNNLPINVWGEIEHFDEAGRPVLKMTQYRIPYPDLQFQILEGTQTLIEAQGQTVILFSTTDGKTFVELSGTGIPYDTQIMVGSEGDKFLVEGLAIPDETFGGYPGLRVFGMANAVDPVSGEANEMTVTANQINIYEEPPADIGKPANPPTLTIDKVELVYFVSNPYYQVSDPNYDRRSPYVQPVWHFSGHFENGDGFDMLIQALKQEFLLPEISPGLSPG